MLKTRSKIVAISGIAAVAVVALYVIAAMPNSTTMTARSPPPTPIGEIGNTVDLSTASQAFGHPIKVPSFLPEQAKLRMVKADGDKMVTVIFAPIPITEQTLDEEIVRSKGIFMMYTKQPANFDLDAWMKGYVAQGSGRLETLNGKTIIVNDRNPQLGIISQIYMFEDDVQIYMSGDYPLEVLLKVAASLQ